MPEFPLLQTDVDLRPLNTLGLPARARYFVRITQAEQLLTLSNWAELTGLPRLILGGGSNVVLTQDFPGVVLHMGSTGRRLVGEDQDFFYVQAAAGESWHEVVVWTLEQGWPGLENLSLIPGSMGATPMQNIGAYGVELKDYFHSLRWFEFATGTMHTLTDVQFGYRDSIFKNRLHNLGVIVDVTLALPKLWQARLSYAELAKAVSHLSRPTAKEISAAVCQIRRAKLPDPAQWGNAGSFFKNPMVSAEHEAQLRALFPGLISYPQTGGRCKLAAGWLIEQAGWKGRSLGQAGVYQNQALVLVNLGAATGREISALAGQIMEDVDRIFGVQLEIEPVFV